MSSKKKFYITVPSGITEGAVISLEKIFLKDKSAKNQQVEGTKSEVKSDGAINATSVRVVVECQSRPSELSGDNGHIFKFPITLRDAVKGCELKVDAGDTEYVVALPENFCGRFRFRITPQQYPEKYLLVEPYIVLPNVFPEGLKKAAELLPK